MIYNNCRQKTTERQGTTGSRRKVTYMKSSERIEIEKELNVEIGSRLKEFRENMFESQGDAIANIDYRILTDASAWSRYETGDRKIPFTVLKELNLNYGLDLNWLITGKAPATMTLPLQAKELMEQLQACLDNCSFGN